MSSGNWIGQTRLADAVQRFRNLSMLGRRYAALRATPEYAELCAAWDEQQRGCHSQGQIDPVDYKQSANALGEAIARCAVTAGIYNGESPVSGAQLVQLCWDMAQEIIRLRDGHAEGNPEMTSEHDKQKDIEAEGQRAAVFHNARPNCRRCRNDITKCDNSLALGCVGRFRSTPWTPPAVGLVWHPFNEQPPRTGKYLVAHRGTHNVRHYLHPGDKWEMGTMTGWQGDVVTWCPTHWAEIVGP